MSVHEPGRWKRVNKDDLRSMLDDGVYSKTNEELIRKVQEKLVRTSLHEGFDVIIDNTHLVAKTLKHVHLLAESIGDTRVIEKCFNTSVEECLRRNALRDPRVRVPDDAIVNMAKGSGLDKGKVLEDKEVTYPALVKPVIEQDASLPRVVICDLDGTLAILNGRNPYDASICESDGVNQAVRCVLDDSTRELIFVSGREEKCREQSERWITKLFAHKNYRLFMRPTSDMRRDSIIKREIYDNHIRGKYYVEFVIDDRPQVVRMWRYELGLIIFQLDDKEF